MSGLTPQAENFLRELERGLASLPVTEREDIVAEIRAHLLERGEAGGDPARTFGPADEYAAAFVQERALVGALAEGTSWALGRALVAGVSRLSRWYVLAVVGLAHVYGAILIALAVLKPIFPEHVGVFVGRVFAIGAVFGDDITGAHEILGWWAIPAFLASGVLVLWGAHVLLRALVRWRLAGVSRARAVPGAAQAAET